MEIINKKVIVKINNDYLVEFGKEYLQTPDLRCAKIFNSIENAVEYCKKFKFYTVCIERKILCDFITVSHKEDIIKRARCRAILGLSLTEIERNLFLLFGDKNDIYLYLKLNKKEVK
jgi:hypothetical protein